MTRIDQHIRATTAHLIGTGEPAREVASALRLESDRISNIGRGERGADALRDCPGILAEMQAVGWGGD